MEPNEGKGPAEPQDKDAQKPTVETLVQQITESIERIRPFGADNTSQTDPNTDTGSAESQEKCFQETAEQQSQRAMELAGRIGTIADHCRRMEANEGTASTGSGEKGKGKLISPTVEDTAHAKLSIRPKSDANAAEPPRDSAPENPQQMAAPRGSAYKTTTGKACVEEPEEMDENELRKSLEAWKSQGKGIQ